MEIDFERQSNHRANYYDRDFNLVHIKELVDYPQDLKKEIARSDNFETMIDFTENIAMGQRFLRAELKIGKL